MGQLTETNIIKAFYKPAFSADDLGHGGQRRSWQIRHLYKDFIELIDIDQFKTTFYPALLRIWTGLSFLLSNRLPLRSLRHISSTGFSVLNLVRLIREHPNVCHFLWEPGSKCEDFHIPLICDRHGIKVIAFPHNLVSLVPQRVSGLSGAVSPDWFSEELELLRICDSVVAISSEEQWLLCLYGINAIWLPYVPSARLYNELLKVRKHRLGNPTNGPLFMMGTADNPPTLLGMREVLDFFVEDQLVTPLVVAGYGTEVLAAEYSPLPDNISILGSVDAVDMQASLGSCSAVLVFQRATTGALTKLQELRIAGVPVVANDLSLRSYGNIEGFYSLGSIEDLKTIDTTDFQVPAVPLHWYEQAVENSIRVVRKTLGQGNGIEFFTSITERGSE